MSKPSINWTTAGDMVMQHGTSSITLAGVDADTPLSALL